MSKHTPGPWSTYNNFGDQMLKAESPKGQIELAAIFKSSEYQPVLPVEANARLIAAAPNLLSALKEAQSSLCEHCPQMMDTVGEQVGEHTDACLAAMDAIDKAEGKS